jgi:hypothetical protein
MGVWKGGPIPAIVDPTYIFAGHAHWSCTSQRLEVQNVVELT